MSDLLTPAPTGGSFTRSDRDILGRFWHPVAFAAELGDQPLAAMLLDIPLVLFRDGDRLAAAVDRCPHRGSRLSRGWMKDGQLVCPYHGLHYGLDGQCTRIPAQADSKKISDRLRLDTFPIATQNNLVWVCLSAEPKGPRPSWSELGDSEFQHFTLPSFACRTSAARYCENFNDVAHFSWVHRGTFGLQDSAEIPSPAVAATDTGLHHEVVYRQIDRDRFDKGEGSMTESFYRYDFALPFANHMRIDFGAGRTQHIFSVARPTTVNSCRIFVQILRNYDLDQPIEEAIRFEQAVAAEDLAVIEHIDPAELPLDAAGESHIWGDRWSATYRKKLKDIGLGRSDRR